MAEKRDYYEVLGIAKGATDDEIKKAYESLDPRFVATLEKAAENIRAFHRQQIRPSFVITGEDGIVMGQKVMPIAKVGVYVPGGTDHVLNLPKNLY